MNTFRIILIILLPLAATWITFCNRPLLLIELGRVPLSTHRAAFGSVLVMQLSCVPIFYELLTSPLWAERPFLLTLPLQATSVGFVVSYLIYIHLDERWQRSLVFKSAMFVPWCGCLLAILIWWHDRRHRHLPTK
jgi:hypothetical protein